ncbi:MAG: ester cyclase [Candidatus Aminicenantes bacterium]|nr:ester cyclase [Candidatus Aminicenantes bacterium]MDH5385068.1 ester cyclase [Candidatus Aminicenantes bacterium]MDH5743538.1 ester cyclase [Candidatus Aminicenantes bacterium]
MKKLLMIIPLVILLCFTFSCQQQVKEGITEEKAQAFTDRILEMWNEANLTIVDEVYAPEIVRHDCGVPEAIVGLENVKNYLENLFNAFPDLNLTVDETIVAGNKMAQRWTMTGTNTGSMNDMPPTGRNVRFSGVSIGHFVNGKAVEIWDFYNVLDMMQQLGFTLVPPQPPEPPEEIK